jgi:hypothetical protein
VLQEAIDGEFFPALVPGATVILLANRMKDPRRWQMKIRLGEAAPPGLTLHALDVGELDIGYGGRWNAGSNKRGGGTELTPQAYVDHIRERLKRWNNQPPESQAKSSN